ncbi:hypothetical protein DSO57_1009277 [Entomophthora muscae]|uniref:Uncharacterized protein n=1 Tax=Entomophthora muscae TaxID=34485 RepID=A0ACC2USF8_9FUNG|nr:hypothetical protein DSO57_1009277 [Entomophthora muscae]
MNYSYFILLFTLLVATSLGAQNEQVHTHGFVGIPLEDFSDEISLFQLRQRYTECKARGKGPNFPTFSKAMREMVANIQQLVDQLIIEYKIHDVPTGIGFDAWDYVFSSNIYYLVYKKIDNKKENQRMYDKYKVRVLEFYRIANEAIAREFRLTMARLRQPIPDFHPTPEGIAMGAVGCTSLGVIITLVESSKALFDAHGFTILSLKGFKEEWGLE